MGHINFTGGMESDRKGIYGDVKLGSDDPADGLEDVTICR